MSSLLCSLFLHLKLLPRAIKSFPFFWHTYSYHQRLAVNFSNVALNVNPPVISRTPHLDYCLFIGSIVRSTNPTHNHYFGGFYSPLLLFNPHSSFWTMLLTVGISFCLICLTIIRFVNCPPTLNFLAYSVVEFSWILPSILQIVLKPINARNLLE